MNARQPYVILFIYLAVSGLSACTFSPRMEVTSAHAVELSGRWMLDHQASDDVRARLTPLFEKKERQSRKAERRFEMDSGEGSGPDRSRGPPVDRPESVQGQAMSNMRWMQGQRQRESQALINAMLPANEITIAQSSHALKFASNKGEGTRTLVPGEKSSLFAALGGFVISSGWDGSTFVIESRGTAENNIQLIERYTLIDNGTRLEERLEMRLPTISKQLFRLIYRRE